MRVFLETAVLVLVCAALVGIGALVAHLFSRPWLVFAVPTGVVLLVFGLLTALIHFSTHLEQIPI
jgi:hypothetical protein